MINSVAAVIYCMISFITWLSVAFSMIGKFADEKHLFLNLTRSILVYIVGGLTSAIMTLVSYFLICSLQKMI